MRDLGFPPDKCDKCGNTSFNLSFSESEVIFICGKCGNVIRGEK